MYGDVYTSTGERMGASTGKGSFSCLGHIILRPLSLEATTLASLLSSSRLVVRLFALDFLRAKMKIPASRRKKPIPAPMATPLITTAERDLLCCGVVVLELVEEGLVGNRVGPGVGSCVVLDDVAMFMFVGSANNEVSSLRYMTVIG
jgi:hypothetical protein